MLQVVITILPGEFSADQRTGGSLVPLVQSLAAEVVVLPASHHLQCRGEKTFSSFPNTQKFFDYDAKTGVDLILYRVEIVP